MIGEFPWISILWRKLSLLYSWSASEVQGWVVALGCPVLRFETGPLGEKKAKRLSLICALGIDLARKTAAWSIQRFWMRLILHLWLVSRYEPQCRPPYAASRRSCMSRHGQPIIDEQDIKYSIEKRMIIVCRPHSGDGRLPVIAHSSSVRSSRIYWSP